MSDRELVTFDPGQFNVLVTWIKALNETLNHIERTLFTGLGALAQDGEAGDKRGSRLTFPDLPRLELDQLLGQLVERATEVMATQGRLRGLLLRHLTRLLLWSAAHRGLHNRA